MTQFLVLTICDTHYFDTLKQLETWVQRANEKGWKQGEDYIIFQKIKKIDDFY